MIECNLREWNALLGRRFLQVVWSVLALVCHLKDRLLYGYPGVGLASRVARLFGIIFDQARDYFIFDLTRDFFLHKNLS